MKVAIVVLLSLLLTAGAVAAQQAELKDQKAKLSYSIGVDVGRQLKEQFKDVNPDVVARGIKDAVSGSKTLLTDQEMGQILTAFRQEMMAKRLEERKTIGEKNKIDGEKFLADNKKKQGIVTLPSGLQYKVLKDGAGKSPKVTDTVTVHYRGTLVDGTEFDNSTKRGQPASFKANGVIPGWTEALPKMKVGSKWQLFIPPSLAYGDRGAGPIGPNAVLIFEVELLDTKE
jgi:FKBP-type peptidyl-prolyl cis-trans isomerase FklB